MFVFGAPGPTDEECLHLNVWAPGGDGKPAIVFIHGGGFTVGSASPGISNGARLARAADAVVVSIIDLLGMPGADGLFTRAIIQSPRTNSCSQPTSPRHARRRVADA